MKFLILFIFGGLLMLTSCNNPEAENQLKQRELSLLTKEQEFEAKAKDYEMLKAMRDSLQQFTNTTVAITIPENMLGKWNGKMICTESNCSENVIGDLRNDIWEFSEGGVRIINKTGGERKYTGKLTGSEIMLISDNNLSAITLQLPTENTDRIKGSRELTGNYCLSKFSVDLEKIKN